MWLLTSKNTAISGSQHRRAAPLVCFAAILPESHGLSTCGCNERRRRVARRIARSLRCQWCVWCVSWVAVVCWRVGEFCRADASLASVMSVLASRRDGLPELTLTESFTLPTIPPLSVDSPNQTFHPSGAVYRFGESLGIVSFVRIGKPKWFVWGRWRVHLAQQPSNHWLTFNLFITRCWVKNRTPRVFGGSIKIRAQLSCEY